MNKVFLHPRALKEEATRFYKERSPIAARRFLAEIKRAKEMIISFPMAWPLFEKGTRRFLLKKFPYSVIYTKANDHYEIVAIMHMAQRPGYWFGRLDD